MFTIGDPKYTIPLSMIEDFLTIYSTVKRASDAHFDANDRLCYHVNCPEYEANYCNCFPNIKEFFSECTFLECVDNLRKVIGGGNNESADS